MSNKKNSTLWGGVLSSILIILVTGSLSLAILDKENRPAYFDIAKVAVGYAFGSMRLQGNSNDTEESDNSD